MRYRVWIVLAKRRYYRVQKLSVKMQCLAMGQLWLSHGQALHFDIAAWCCDAGIR